VDIDGPEVAMRRRGRHGIEQLLARERPAWLPGQDLEQGGFPCPEVNAMPADPQLTRGRIERQADRDGEP
jgi:hypothetical protein